jgi:hypothetical protein
MCRCRDPSPHAPQQLSSGSSFPGGGARSIFLVSSVSFPRIIVNKRDIDAALTYGLAPRPLCSRCHLKWPLTSDGRRVARWPGAPGRSLRRAPRVRLAGSLAGARGEVPRRPARGPAAVLGNLKRSFSAVVFAFRAGCDSTCEKKTGEGPDTPSQWNNGQAKNHGLPSSSSSTQAEFRSLPARFSPR